GSGARHRSRARCDLCDLPRGGLPQSQRAVRHAARQPHVDRSSDRSAKTMTTRPLTEAERITELEDELAAARRTIDVLIARLERPGPAPPAQSELFDAAVRLGNVLEERTREVEDARAEFRALRANLDQIVRQRTRALAESEAQLRTKNAELERQSKIKLEFFSIAAHELRTPLTSIVGYLDLFQEGRFGELPPLIGRPLSSVRRNAHRLRRLVEDMLDVSRIEAGKMTFN